ncbi:hypothetical protein [Paenibacillus chitinolyticus]|uniref:hypothetical protein n=1 Tax=Paenibacillus chitinolyticus TaxID=79263 RepID=UPI003670B8A6
MDFILQYKWAFFIGGEAVFWGSIVCFLLLRYVWNYRKLSKVFILLFLLSDLWMAAIGYLDYRRTGQFETFQLVILIFLAYALFFGRGDLRKLDAFIAGKTAKWRGVPENELPPPELKLTGAAHTRRELKNFSVHFILYAAVTAVLIVTYGILPAGSLPPEPSGPPALRLVLAGIVNHETTASVLKVWSIILAVDAAITLSYVIFPKKPKKTATPG